MLSLSKHNFDTVVAENELLVIGFSAHWCAPCRFFSRVCEALEKQNSDVVFGTIDIEAEPELADEFSVRSVPAIMILKCRVVVYANTGALSETALYSLIQNAKALDLDASLKEKQDNF